MYLKTNYFYVWGQYNNDNTCDILDKCNFNVDTDN